MAGMKPSAGPGGTPRATTLDDLLREQAAGTYSLDRDLQNARGALDASQPLADSRLSSLSDNPDYLASEAAGRAAEQRLTPWGATKAYAEPVLEGLAAAAIPASFLGGPMTAPVGQLAGAYLTADSARAAYEDPSLMNLAFLAMGARPLVKKGLGAFRGAAAEVPESLSGLGRATGTSWEPGAMPAGGPKAPSGGGRPMGPATNLGPNPVPPPAAPSGVASNGQPFRSTAVPYRNMTPKIYDPQAEVDGIRAMDARRTIREGAQALEKERTSGTGGFTMSVPNTPAPAAPPAAPLKVGVTGSSHGPNEAYYNGKKYNIGTSGDAQSAAKDAKGKAMRASAAKKQAASLTALEAQGGDWRQTLPPAQLVKEANLLHPKQTQQELVNDLLAGGYPGWDKMNVTKIKGPMYPEGKVPGSKAKAVRQREHIAHKKS